MKFESPPICLVLGGLGEDLPIHRLGHSSPCTHKATGIRPGGEENAVVADQTNAIETTDSPLLG